MPIIKHELLIDHNDYDINQMHKADLNVFKMLNLLKTYGNLCISKENYKRYENLFNDFSDHYNMKIKLKSFENCYIVTLENGGKKWTQN